VSKMNDRKSGYDPTTQVCWQFHNKGDDPWCKCPAHTARYPDRELVLFGRCRSGKQWFWVAYGYCEKPTKLHGWAETKDAATAAAVAAVLTLRAGLPIIANFVQYCASGTLKDLNKAKRAAWPATDTSDAHVVEYLYFWGDSKYRIVKKTRERIYYDKEMLHLDGSSSPFSYLDDQRIGFITRRKLAQKEYWSLTPPPPGASPKAPSDLRQLKAEMSAAHPDCGGTNAAFIAARRAYVEARRRMRAVA
jgi:hypothetical protein